MSAQPQTIKWWQWHTVQRKLELWAKSLLRVPTRYHVAFTTAISTARQSSALRCIEVSPEAFGHGDQEQYAATRGLLAHEVGHANYSGPQPKQRLLRKLVGGLEDERIERCLAADSPPVAFFLDAVGDLAWEKAPPLNDLKAMKVADPDDPLLVIAATLLWRWEHDKGKGKRTKMRLSRRNRRRWYAVKDLVEASWTVESSAEVVRIARRILDILELPEDVEIPDWLKDLQEMLDQLAKGSDDPVPGVPLPGMGGSGGGGVPSSIPDLPEVPDDVDVVPAPYGDLVAEMSSVAHLLAEELKAPEPEVRVMPHEYRGRYSFRQEQRTPNTPNLAKLQLGYRVPSSAWGIVVDRSGSINSMLKPLQQGLMSIHLALEELALPHRIAAFEGNALLKDFGHTSPVPRALIAGLQGMTCSRVMPTLRPTFEALMARPEEVKVLLLLHDGTAHDPDALASWAQEARCIPGFFFWGIYLGNNPQEEAAMKELLGADRLIACPPGELHLKFGNVLRALRPVGV